MGAHRETGVEEQYAPVCPGRQEAALVGRRSEAWVVACETYVHVFERRRSWCGRADGECESMGLVVVVVGILADDDGFHARERGVPGPVLGLDRGRFRE